jgi:hypothetical protein
VSLSGGHLLVEGGSSMSTATGSDALTTPLAMIGSDRAGAARTSERGVCLSVGLEGVETCGALDWL